MPPLSQEHKHQALVQLRSGVSTCKSCRFSGHDPIFYSAFEEGCKGEIERQRGGRPKLLID